MEVVEEKRALLEEELARLLGSENFRNTESLRRLLAYLAKAHMEGRGRELKEYSIGRDVMGKPEDYDPRIDSSVRVQVSKLRQRLEQYYATEGRQSVYQIRLPKGNYEIALEASPEADVPRVTIDEPKVVSGRWRLAAILLGLTTVILGVACAVLLLQPALMPAPVAAVQSTPEMRQFWAPFLQAERPLTVVLGSPLFIRFHSGYYRDAWSNTWDEVEANVPLDAIAKAVKSPTPATETRRWAPFGEAVASFRVAQLLSPAKSGFQIRRSSVLSWEDMRASDLIILGPRKFNPQLRDLPVEQDFVIEEGEVRNLRPRAGELPVYRRTASPEVDDIPDDFALITRLRASRGFGEILVLASTTTEGTWAAAEYVSNPVDMAELVRNVSAGQPGLPDRFQVLIRCQFKNQVPIRSTYMTHHVLEERQAPDVTRTNVVPSAPSTAAR
ncbi:MAG: hypothetical protein KJZ70_09830 [Bryobacterales bacterium]|nr:hypothetical protein [Bryobacterales bacterium]